MRPRRVFVALVSTSLLVAVASMAACFSASSGGTPTGPAFDAQPLDSTFDSSGQPDSTPPTDARPEAAADGGTDTAVDAPADASLCVVLDTTGAPLITSFANTDAAPPVMTGGVVAPGTYFLTGVTAYDPLNQSAGAGGPFRLVLDLTATTFTFETESYLPDSGSDAAPNRVVVAGGDYSTDASTMTRVRLCGQVLVPADGGGANVTLVLGYTVTGSTLLLSSELGDSGILLVDTYAKQ